MVRVRQHDLGAEVDQVARQHPLDGALRADGHERRRLHDAVGRRHLAAAREAVGGGHPESETRWPLRYSMSGSGRRAGPHGCCGFFVPGQPACRDHPGGVDLVKKTSHRRDLRRTFERARGVAGLGRVGHREPGPAALRAGPDSHRPRRPLVDPRPPADDGGGGRRDREGPPGAGPAGARRPRGVPGAASGRRDAADVRAGQRRDGRAGERLRGGARARRDLPRAARPVRRGRHGAGAARTRRRALRRRGRARLGGGDGQGDDEDGLRRARPAHGDAPRRLARPVGGVARRGDGDRRPRACRSPCSSSRPTSGRASASRR